MNHTIEPGTNKIRITGDRNLPLMAALLDLYVNNKELSKELEKVLEIIPFDGYPLNIYEMKEN